MANRFQFALPEPRPRDGWFRVGNLDITTTALLVIAGVASMFLYAISKETFNKLIFDPLAVRDGEIWRLFTWPIANPPSHIWLVLTLLFFWIIGHAVEGMVGPRPLHGADRRHHRGAGDDRDRCSRPRTSPRIAEMGLGMLATALFVVFAAEHPNMPFFFGVPAWIIATVFVGIDVLLWVGDRVWGTLVLMGSATLLALIMVRQWGYVQAAHVHPQVRRLDAARRLGGRPSSAGARSAVPPTSAAAWSRDHGRHPSRPAPRPTPPPPRSSSTSCSTRSRPAASTR